MDQNFLVDERYKLESQIRESFGRVVYSQTCQEKKIQHLLKTHKNIELGKIILSGITAGSIITVIFTDSMVVNILSALISTGTFILNTLFKENNYVEDAQLHRKAADLLWIIREEYVSLLVDFNILPDDDIRKKRDELLKRTSDVYSNYPRTDKKSYKEAQKALKVEEEQTFHEIEIDNMLPNSIRRSNRK